ncbi:hypothetical protein GGF32_009173 [Allomyces javanicus]|nr:hypothetical protein GGF32_009173 [Allomyces javanicus]
MCTSYLFLASLLLQLVYQGSRRNGDDLFDPAENLAGMTPVDLFFRDQRLVCKMARECELFGMHLESFDEELRSALFLDVFTKEMLAFLETKRMTLTLVAATQIFLDIHHVMHDDVVLAHDKLRAACQALEPGLMFYRTHPDHGYGSAKTKDLPTPMRTLLEFLSLGKLLNTLDPTNINAQSPDSNARSSAPPKQTITTLFQLHL